MKCDYVILMPGNPSSNIQSMKAAVVIIDLIVKQKVVIPIVSQSCNIYNARNGCLKNQKNGFRKDQKPFEGVIDDYDRMIWIDSDNLINSKDVERLLSHDVDIVAAWYRQKPAGEIDDTNKAACGYFNREAGYGSIRALTAGELKKTEGLIEVDYAGMGLMIVKKGVFERMEYPWFRSNIIEWAENGVEMADIETDDDGFCNRAKQLGFKIYVDPKVYIKHEKLMAI
jgi:hypothetical protein